MHVLGRAKFIRIKVSGSLVRHPSVLLFQSPTILSFCCQRELEPFSHLFKLRGLHPALIDPELVEALRGPAPSATAVSSVAVEVLLTGGTAGLREGGGGAVGSSQMRPNDELMFLEQLVCAQGSTFFGSKGSSASEGVVKLRSPLPLVDERTNRWVAMSDIVLPSTR